jgi:hypothetical protein
MCSVVAAAGLTPAGLEQYRLDRLMELRAVIDSLRAERGNDSRTAVRHSAGN